MKAELTVWSEDEVTFTSLVSGASRAVLIWEGSRITGQILFLKLAHGEAFRDAVLATWPLEPLEEPDEDVAVCERCKEERIEPPVLAVIQTDEGEWLCDDHYARIPPSAEEIADARYDQDKDRE